MTLAIALQLLLALGIFNVWIFRRNRPTAYRPDGAANIREEFQRYGFPEGTWKVVGASKVLIAGMLIAGIFFPVVVPFAAGALTVLMIGAVASHLRVGDPMVKSVPALLMLAMSAAVVVSYTA